MKRNNKPWLILLLVYIVALVCATFFDQDIAAYLYNPNQMFSNFIAKLTYVVACYVVLLSVFVLVRLYHQQGRLSDGMWATLLVVGLLATGVLIYLKYEQIYVLAIHVVAYYLFWKYMSTLTPGRIEQLERPAKYSLLIIITAIACVELLKLGVGRVRPRSVDGNSPFSPWYQINGFSHRDFVTAADEIKSFPSGHSAWAASTLTLWLYVKELRFSKAKTYTIGFLIGAWIVTVMFTRLVLGAHFLSDVSIGSALMFLSYYLYTIQYYRRYYGMRAF